MSWQEVAETPLFRGKRKHRSLSQRKHTISKMGPRFHEAETLWTPDDDRKLCGLGDAGRTLGDIYRKFRSRNAERCLNRYFYLKDCQTSGRRPEPLTSAMYSLNSHCRLHPSMVVVQSPYTLPPVSSSRSDARYSDHRTPSVFAQNRIPSSLGSTSGDVSNSPVSPEPVSGERTDRPSTSNSQSPYELTGRPYRI